MESLTPSRLLPGILITAGTALLLLLSFLSEGSYGGEDSFMHYLFARYAPAHPLLFLDHWGKPLFTLLSAPFAAFGFQGIKVFNILCTAGVAWLGYAIARKLNWERPWLAIPLIQFNALFLVTGISGLTEPLFALVLCGSIALYLHNRILSACILISFLPFARSEGNLMIAVFVLVMLVEKKWRYLPLLATGTLLMSLIGGWIKGDFLWLRNENPYQGAADIYGHGDILHFVRANREIFGVPQSLMVVVGGLYLTVSWLRNKTWGNFKPLVLIAGPFLVYMGAHSVFWHFGLFGSYGLVRVMAAVVPLAGLISLAGLNGVAELLHRLPAWAKETVVLIPMAFVVYDPFFQYPLPYPLDDRQLLMKEMAQRVRENPPRRIFAAHPYFFHASGIDIFDTQYRRPLEACMRETLLPGDLIIWDNQFGPNESGMPDNWAETLPIDRDARLVRGEAVVEVYQVR